MSPHYQAITRIARMLSKVKDWIIHATENQNQNTSHTNDITHWKQPLFLLTFLWPLVYFFIESFFQTESNGGGIQCSTIYLAKFNFHCIKKKENVSKLFSFVKLQNHYSWEKRRLNEPVDTTFACSVCMGTCRFWRCSLDSAAGSLDYSTRSRTSAFAGWLNGFLLQFIGIGGTVELLSWSWDLFLCVKSHVILDVFWMKLYFCSKIATYN